MMNFLRKHMRKIFIITILAFLGGTFMGGGAYLFSPSKDYDAAATVNGSKIPMKTFKSVYDSTIAMYRQSTKESLSPEQLEEVKVRTLQALVQDEIFYQQALKYKIVVTDAELKNDIQSSAMFINNNQFDARAYYSFLNKLRMTPKDYESIRKKQIAGEKLKITMASAIKISDAEYENAVENGLKITKEEMLQAKANKILNEWFIGVARSYNIVTNESILKQI